jgi:hypothetical protein
VGGEGVGQAERGGELGAEQARAEDPQRHVGAGAGNRLHCLAGLHGAEQRLQLQHVLGEGVGGGRIAAQGADRLLVGAGRPAEA